MEQSAAYSAGRTLQGENPFAIIGSPLAAALRSAYDQHQAHAKPLPDYVKQTLARFFKPAYLETLRYAIGTVEISVPNAINVFQSDTAVTVNNLIIFQSEPGQAYGWWAHEIQHTIQYLNLGFDGFAYQYTVNYGALENEAAMVGQQVQFTLNQPAPRPVVYAPYYGR